jgi:hypothetical protein
MKLTLTDRKYIWAKLVHQNNFALLDRFFCSLTWNNYFTITCVTSIPRLLPDHNPLIMHIYSSLPTYTPFKFDKVWLTQKGLLIYNMVGGLVLSLKII